MRPIIPSFLAALLPLTSPVLLASPQVVADGGDLLPESPDETASDEPEDGLEDLLDLSLEDLMNIDVEVTSVSRKSERLQKTAAAVHVITAEDIRRSGMRSIPDALRMAPGIRVIRLDSGRYAVAARGFAWEYGDKVLVLVDGRSVHSPLLSTVEWSTLDLPIEEVERIEVILGPGGTMWGANAVNGVINIITKSAKADREESLTVVYGDEERRDVIVRGGTRLGEKSFLRGFARTNERSSLGSNSTGIEDGYEQVRLGLRADMELSDGSNLMFSASAFDMEDRQGKFLASTAFPYVRPVVAGQDSLGGNILARWTKTHDSGSISTLQTSVAYIDAEGEYVTQERQQFDIFYQHQFELSDRQDFVWGVSLRKTHVNFVDTDYFTWNGDRNDTYVAGFLQDQYRATDDLTFTAGVKLEDNPFTGLEVQPNLRFSYSSSKTTTFWGAISRAIQTPSEAYRGARLLLRYVPDQGSGFDTSFVLNPATGNTPESVVAFETGVRRKLGSRATLSLSAYLNEYRDAQAARIDDPVITGPGTAEVPLHFEGVASFTTMGLECAGTYAISEDLVARASYSYTHVDEEYDDGIDVQVRGFDVGTAKHLAYLGASYDLTDRWELDSNLYFVGRQANRGDPIDESFRLDLRAGWRPTDGISATLAVQGLLHDGEREFSRTSVSDPYQAQTGAYLGLRFQF